MYYEENTETIKQKSEMQDKTIKETKHAKQAKEAKEAKQAQEGKPAKTEFLSHVMVISDDEDWDTIFFHGHSAVLFHEKSCGACNKFVPVWIALSNFFSVQEDKKWSFYSALAIDHQEMADALGVTGIPQALLVLCPYCIIPQELAKECKLVEYQGVKRLIYPLKRVPYREYSKQMAPWFGIKCGQACTYLSQNLRGGYLKKKANFLLLDATTSAGESQSTTSEAGYLGSRESLVPFGVKKGGKSQFKSEEKAQKTREIDKESRSKLSTQSSVIIMGKKKVSANTEEIIKEKNTNNSLLSPFISPISYWNWLENTRLLKFGMPISSSWLDYIENSIELYRNPVSYWSAQMSRHHKYV